jgi:hypothetical protein
MSGLKEGTLGTDKQGSKRERERKENDVHEENHYYSLRVDFESCTRGLNSCLFLGGTSEWIDNDAEVEWPFSENDEEEADDEKAVILSQEHTIDLGVDWIDWLLKVAATTGEIEAAGDPEHKDDDYCSVYLRKKKSSTAVRLACDWKHLSRSEIRCHARLLGKLGVIIQLDPLCSVATWIPSTVH